MSYPRQDSVAVRLQAMNVRALSQRADAMQADLMVLWRRAARLLKADIAAAYGASSPRGGRWDLTALNSSGTYVQLSQRAAAVLTELRDRVKSKAHLHFKDLKSEGARRQRWVVAQVTPPSRHSRLRLGMSEADVPLGAGFAERWDQWVAGYHEALMRNLRMNALNSGDLTDAIAEVDATRVSTPAYTLDSALNRLWDYYSWDASMGGMHQAVDEAGDDAGEEIWRTSGDLRVCDDCDANEGLRVKDADGTIPLHPNCHCFPQFVPASYAELLRSGDAEDRDLAAEMDTDGVAPNALVVRNSRGDIVGRTVVDFEDWEAAQGMAVRGNIQ